MKIRFFIILLLMGVLTSCSNKPVKLTTLFQLEERNYLYAKDEWAFSGRLAVSDQNNAISASINWKHLKNKDVIELFGPLGMGRVIVNINGTRVLVSFDGKQVQHYGSADDVIKKYTGVLVPISALKYWVLGLVDPENTYVREKEGFVQLGWRVNYQKMQLVKQDKLPKKIKVNRKKSTMKLIIDQWEE